MKTGIVLFAHGSRIAEANDAVRAVAEEAARSGGFGLVEVGFLEPVHPDLDEAVARLVGKGAQRILVIPYFLTLGLHLQRDLPRIIGRISSIHNHIEIRVAAPLDGHQALAEIVRDRARETLSGWE